MKDLAISPKGEVYAAGKLDAAFGGVARWDGSAWAPLGSGLSDPWNPPDEIGQGQSLAFLGADLFVAGYFAFAGGKPAEGLALWTSRPEELGIVARPKVFSRRAPAWSLEPDGRVILTGTPAAGGFRCDALGRAFGVTRALPWGD